MKNEYLGQGQPMLLNLISRENLSSDHNFLSHLFELHKSNYFHIEKLIISKKTTCFYINITISYTINA